MIRDYLSIEEDPLDDAAEAGIFFPKPPKPEIKGGRKTNKK